jgi:tetratricopeptide (TPR) repeat protein
MKQDIKKITPWFCLLLIVVAIFFILKDKNPNIDPPREAAIMFERGEKDKATKILEKYSKNNPNNINVKNELAKMYFQSADYEKFIQFVEENKLSTAYIYSMLASACQITGKLEKSEEYYNKAIKANPVNAKQYINFSAYYQSVGATQKALDILEKGLKSGAKGVALLVTAASVSIKLDNTEKAEFFLKEAQSIDPKNAQVQTMLNRI